MNKILDFLTESEYIINELLDTYSTKHFSQSFLDAIWNFNYCETKESKNNIGQLTRFYKKFIGGTDAIISDLGNNTTKLDQYFYVLRDQNSRIKNPADFIPSPELFADFEELVNSYDLADWRMYRVFKQLRIKYSMIPLHMKPNDQYFDCRKSEKYRYVIKDRYKFAMAECRCMFHEESERCNERTTIPTNLCKKHHTLLQLVIQPTILKDLSFGGLFAKKQALEVQNQENKEEKKEPQDQEEDEETYNQNIYDNLGQYATLLEVLVEYSKTDGKISTKNTEELTNADLLVGLPCWVSLITVEHDKNLKMNSKFPVVIWEIFCLLFERYGIVNKGFLSVVEEAAEILHDNIFKVVDFRLIRQILVGASQNQQKYVIPTLFQVLCKTSGDLMLETTNSYEKFQKLLDIYKIIKTQEKEPDKMLQKNNCHIYLIDNSQYPVILATRDIADGEELFCDYGSMYFRKDSVHVDHTTYIKNETSQRRAGSKEAMDEEYKDL